MTERSESSLLFDELVAALEPIRKSPPTDQPSLLFGLGQGLGARRAAVLFLLRAAFEALADRGQREVLIEGYVRGLSASQRAEELARWGYPACVVRIDADTMAVAASPPTSDANEIVAFAESVARGASRDSMKRAFVTGPAAAAVIDALAVVGIHGVETSFGPTTGSAAPPPPPAAPSLGQRLRRRLLGS